MSITGINPNLDRTFKKTFHHRQDSTELDVFEAARYFSAHATSFTEKFMLREEIRHKSDYWSRGSLGGGRSISLDLPTTRNHHHYSTAVDQKQAPIKDKNYKQPRSPGARIASFLNSLFSQSSKKKSKSAPPDSDSPGGVRRKRRSSISHFSFGSSNSYNNRDHISEKDPSSINSVYSGLRTPPATYANTPTKNDPRSFSDRKQYLHCNGNEIARNPDFSWIDHEKFRFGDGSLDKNSDLRSININNKYSNSDRYHTQILKNEYDDGAESDSSSDLFELQNYDLVGYSRSFRVYETTRLDSINRGAPISSS